MKPLHKLKERAEIFVEKTEALLSVGALLQRAVTIRIADGSYPADLRDEVDRWQKEQKHSLSELRRFVADVDVLMAAPTVEAERVMNDRFDQLLVQQHQIGNLHDAIIARLDHLARAERA